MILKNLSIWTGSGEHIQSGYIETAGKIIKAVGPMEACPSGEGIDLSGKFAYPGFIDAHSHLGLFGDSLGFEGDDCNESNDPSTPQLRAIDAVNVLDRGFLEAREAGVTTVMTGPGSANPIAGQFCAVKTAGRCIDRMIIKAPAAIKMAFGENPKWVYREREESPVTRMATAAIIREQLYKARRYMQDMQRAENDPDEEPPEYDIKCEALLPLLRGEIPAHMHAHQTDDIFTALRIAKEFNFRTVIVHGTGGHEVADILNELNASVITGPILNSRSKPELRTLSLAGTAVLNKAGVKVAICTDHPEVPIGMLPLSAAICHENGLPREEALRAITISAARLSEIDDRVGSIEAGKDADILIYNGDPLALSAAPEAVIIDGVLECGTL